MKRFRSPKQIPNTLKAQWGKLPHERPDMVYTWGEGCSRSDAGLLHNAFNHADVLFGKALVAELESRGYDITTFKFQIKKRNT